ncbi:hypothetical protein [Nonomuraea lactucae]|uniref:hypothetical protein n=1 Tax=Nonomuraea lactucae TaxID=2249762 RepID=UPI000DE42FB5|nr:hypothetical protein [Nonomuraea lactucae]
MVETVLEAGYAAFSFLWCFYSDLDVIHISRISTTLPFLVEFFVDLEEQAVCNFSGCSNVFLWGAHE